MSLYILFVAPILFFIIVGIAIYPTLALYYLVLDSWVIGKLTDWGEILPFMSVNRLMVIVTFVALLLHVAVKAHRIERKLLLSGTGLLLYIFMAYLLWSSLYIMGRNDARLLNNLAFFLIVLMLMGENIERRLKWVIATIVAASTFTLVEAMAVRFMNSGSFIADVSDGSRIHPGFHVLLSIPLLLAFVKITENGKLKLLAKFAIILFTFFVLGRISRTLFSILLVMWLLYFLSGYFNRKWLIVLIPVGLIALGVGVSTEYGRELLRLQTAKTGEADDKVGVHTSGRAEAYVYVWKRYQNGSLLFGNGYDSFRRPKNSLAIGGRATEGSALHSAWLQILTETGIIGAGLYLALFGSALTNFLRSYRKRRDMPSRFYYSQAIFISMLVFFLGGFFDNFGFDYRIFYLILALSAVLGCAPEKAWSSKQSLRSSQNIKNPLNTNSRVSQS